MGLGDGMNTAGEDEATFEEWEPGEQPQTTKFLISPTSFARVPMLENFGVAATHAPFS